MVTQKAPEHIPYDIFVTEEDEEALLEIEAWVREEVFSEGAAASKITEEFIEKEFNQEIEDAYKAVIKQEPLIQPELEVSSISSSLQIQKISVAIDNVVQDPPVQPELLAMIQRICLNLRKLYRNPSVLPRNHLF